VADGTPFGDLAAPASGAPSLDELAKFDLNDLGNAMRLIRLVGGAIDDDGDVDATNATLLFLLGAGWVGFNGRFWDRKFGEDLARRSAHRVAQKVRGLFKEVNGRTGIAMKDYLKWADGCGSAGQTSAMLRQAQSYLTVEIDVFDRDPLALNVRNGTVKLKQGEGARWGVTLHPHDPADRITRMAEASWVEGAAAPKFRKVVSDSMPDPGERAFLHRVLGYSATGCTHEQAFFIEQGLGRDGKSTILDACREVLGGYGAAASPLTFLDGVVQSGSGPSPDLVKLAGDTRLVVLSEPKRGMSLNEGLLKAWTSGSPITARDLNAKPFDFRPVGKLHIECNALPVAKGDDDGIWRRLKTLMFRVQVPEDKVDKTLGAQLRVEERDGILAWLLEGAIAWLENPRGLDPPAGVAKALEDYRKSSSPFGDWLNERCVWGVNAKGLDGGPARTLSADLLDDFKRWAEAQGHEKVMSARAFGDALHQRQILLAGKDAGGRKYRGPIRLKTEAERAADLAREEAGSAPAGSGVEDPLAAELEGSWGGA